MPPETLLDLQDKVARIDARQKKRRGGIRLDEQSNRKGETAEEFHARLLRNIRDYWRSQPGAGKGLDVRRGHEGIISNLTRGVPPQ